MCQAVQETAEALTSGNTGGGNSFLESVGDILLQGATGGLVGYKSDEGGFTGGISTKTYEDVSGATAAKEANELTRQQIEESKRLAAEERSDILAQNAANQVAASRQAGAVKDRSRSTRGVGSSSINNLGGVERDFLGL